MQCQSNLNAGKMGYLKSVSSKTSMNTWWMNVDRIQKWVAVCYKSNMLKWFAHIERMNKDQIAKQNERRIKGWQERKD